MLQHKAFILKELDSMCPHAFRTDISDSPTALYEHPEESRCSRLCLGQALDLQVRGQDSTRTRRRRRHLRRLRRTHAQPPPAAAEAASAARESPAPQTLPQSKGGKGPRSRRTDGS